MVRPIFKAIAVVFLLYTVTTANLFALDNGNLKIKVLSGDGDLESAQKSADHLKTLGYNVARIDLASRSDFTAAIIYFAKTHKAVAQNLASELNILEKNIRPLTWRSGFDIIIVSVESPLSRPESEEDALSKKTPSKKDQKPTADEIQNLEENISFAIAEAHALFVNKEYQLAHEKYKSLAGILVQAQKLCTSPAHKNKISENDNLSIQVLSKNANLSQANTIVEHLSQKGYSVSGTEHTLRRDLVENAIYYSPAVKQNAEEIASIFDGSFALLPMQWSSRYQIIIVSSPPRFDDLQVMDMDEKFSELQTKELQTKENIDLLIYEAFDLLASGSKCQEVQAKFEGIKTHLKRVESLCETAIRLGAPSTGTNDLSMENIKTTTIVNLKEAIDIAMLNNPSIKEVTEKVNAAIQEKKSAYADFLPKASFNYSYTRLNEAPSMNFNLPSEIPIFIDGDPHIISLPFLGSGSIPLGSQDIYSWNLSLSQPLFTGFGLLSQYELKKLNLEINEIQKKTAILNLVRNVKQAYYDLLLAQKLEIVTQEAVKNLRSHTDDAEQFYTQGMIPYNDLLKAQVSLANAIQENVRANSQAKMAVSALNVLLDYNVNQNIEVQEIYALSPNNFQLTDLIHEAVEHRPELELINLAVISSDLAIRAVKSTYYPQVAIVGRYEQTGQDVLASENDYGEVESSSVTVQASWALFKGGKTKYDVAKLKFEKKALEKQYEGAENRIQLEIKNIFENLMVSEKNIKTAQESVAQAKENWRITNLQYQEQIATSTDVLDARTFLSQAQLNYLRAHYGYLKFFADLERAVGKTHSFPANETNNTSPALPN